MGMELSAEMVEENRIELRTRGARLKMWEEVEAIGLRVLSIVMDSKE